MSALSGPHRRIRTYLAPEDVRALLILGAVVLVGVSTVFLYPPLYRAVTALCWDRVPAHGHLHLETHVSNPTDQVGQESISTTVAGSFTYTYGDREFSSQTLTYFNFSGAGHEERRALVRAVNEADHVLCHVNPRHPEQAVLRPFGVAWTDLAPAGFLLALHLIAAGTLLVRLWLRRQWLWYDIRCAVARRFPRRRF